VLIIVNTSVDFASPEVIKKTFTHGEIRIG
jgi:hypothetical protein